MLPLVVSSTALFFVGVAFCYFFVFGQVFRFIQSFAPKSITAAPDIEAYLGFVMTMFIAFGAAFEVPVAVVLLARHAGLEANVAPLFTAYRLDGGVLFTPSRVGLRGSLGLTIAFVSPRTTRPPRLRNRTRSATQLCRFSAGLANTHRIEP